MKDVMRTVGLVLGVIVLFVVALGAFGSSIGSLELLIWAVLLVTALTVVIRRERARQRRR